MTEAVKERPLPTGEGLTFEKMWVIIQETDRQLRENAERMSKEMEERRKETDRQLRENTERMSKEMEERRKEMEERRKETDRQLRENAERMSKEMEERRKEMEERRKEMEERRKEMDRQFKESNERWERLERIVDKNGEQLGGLGNDLGALAEDMVGPSIAQRFNELGYHFDTVAKKGCEVTDKNGRKITEVDILMENGETVIAVEVKFKPLKKHIEHHIKQLKILKESWITIKKEHKNFLGGIAGATYNKKMKEAVHDAGLFVIEQSGDTMRIDMPEGWTPKCF
jgi:hypothetical protein